MIPAVGAAVELPHQPGPESRAAIPEPPTLPIIIDTSRRPPSPPFSTLFAPGGWLFSYGGRTVITGDAMLIGWAWKVSHDTSLPVAPAPAPPAPRARQNRRSSSAGSPAWPIAAGPIRKTPRPPRRLPGPQVRLPSGLMEITYHSGAKVILQGPCTYEVDSARRRLPLAGQTDRESGEWKREWRGRSPKSKIRNPLPSPLSTLPFSPSALPPPSSPTWAPSSASRWTSPAQPVARLPGQGRAAGAAGEQAPVIPLGENSRPGEARQGQSSR